jgi:hypothetical protein
LAIYILRNKLQYHGTIPFYSSSHIITEGPSCQKKKKNIKGGCVGREQKYTKSDMRKKITTQKILDIQQSNKTNIKTYT